VDPSSARTAKANKRVQFGYGLNYLIDLGPHAVIVDVEGTPARTYDEVAATKTMINRTEETFGLKLKRLAADTAYGTGKLLAWLLEKDITPHIPVWERYERTDGISRSIRTTLTRRFDNSTPSIATVAPLPRKSGCQGQATVQRLDRKKRQLRSSADGGRCK